MPAERFASCLAADRSDLACLRDRLRAWRSEANEVTIAVLVERSADGGLRLTCLGGSRRNEWSDEGLQRIAFAADADPGQPALRQRADTCVGRAFGEHMIP